MKTRKEAVFPANLNKTEQLSFDLVNHEREVTALHIISEVLNSDLDSDQVQVRMIHEICRILSAEVGALILIDDDEADIAIKKIMGRDGRWIDQLSMKVDQRGLIKKYLIKLDQLLISLIKNY
jgi:DNA-binding Xre family transcriptional regulator